MKLEINADYQYKSIVKKEYVYGKDWKVESEYSINMKTKDTTDFNERKVKYNERGDVIREEEWKNNGSLLMVDGEEVSISIEDYREGKLGYKTVTEVDYYYDQFGNWLRINYLYNGHVKTSVERLITYYK